MRMLVLIGIMIAGGALAGCQGGPPPSASTRHPAAAQDAQPAPAAGQAEATSRAIAELPSGGTDAAPSNLGNVGRDANGPPINLLRPAAP